MQFIRVVLLMACVSGFAQSDSRIRIADFRSDYLCTFLDSEGFHSDEGYVFSILSDNRVEMRFIEEPYVKYEIGCALNTVQTSESQLVLNCTIPRNALAMNLTMNKATMNAQVEMFTLPVDIFQMKCQTNR